MIMLRKIKGFFWSRGGLRLPEVKILPNPSYEMGYCEGAQPRAQT